MATTEGVAVLTNRVKQTTETTGTGTYDLDGAAPSGFQSFVDAGLTGSAVFYNVTNNIDWEVGIGTISDPSAGAEMTRDTILESSNSGAAVDWAAGEKTVHLTIPPEALARLLSPKVTQVAHGFTPGVPIIYTDASPGPWEEADASDSTKKADAVVVAVPDADSFYYTQGGLAELSTDDWDAVTGESGGLTAGSLYWLGRPSESGGTNLVATQPTVGVRQALLRAISTTAALVFIGDPLAAGPTLRITQAHTVDVTLTAEQMDGRLHTNRGAGGAVRLTLPDAADGLHAEFAQVAASSLTPTPQAGEHFETTDGAEANGKGLVMQSVVSTVKVASDGSTWVVLGDTGTSVIEA